MEVQGSWKGLSNDSGQIARYLRDAIAKVQRQKQRPTAVRIYKAVRQCLEGVSVEQVTAWLELAVRQGELVSIDNDGIMSYREPRHNLNGLTQQPQQQQVLDRNALTPSSDAAAAGFADASSWRFGSLADPYYKFVPQPTIPSLHPSVGWGYPPPPFDSSGHFRYDRIPDSSSYDLWSKTLSAAAQSVPPDEWRDPTFYNFSQNSYKLGSSKLNSGSNNCERNWTGQCSTEVPSSGPIKNDFHRNKYMYESAQFNNQSQTYSRQSTACNVAIPANQTFPCSSYTKSDTASGGLASNVFGNNNNNDGSVLNDKMSPLFVDNTRTYSAVPIEESQVCCAPQSNNSTGELSYGNNDGHVHPTNESLSSSNYPSENIKTRADSTLTKLSDEVAVNRVSSADTNLELSSDDVLRDDDKLCSDEILDQHPKVPLLNIVEHHHRAAHIDSDCRLVEDDASVPITDCSAESHLQLGEREDGPVKCTAGDSSNLAEEYGNAENVSGVEEPSIVDTSQCQVCIICVLRDYRFKIGTTS